MKPYKAGLIGLGHQGMNHFLPGFAQATSAQLIAVCDCKLEKNLVLPQSIMIYQKYEEMIEKESLDFVVVAVPHDEYPSIIALLASRKIHIFKEKPFARNLKEAYLFEQMAVDNGIYIRTIPERRFYPSYTHLPHFIAQIEPLFFIDIKYTLFIEAPHIGWRGQKKLAGGGCILDMGYHMLDQLTSIFGLPTSVYAQTSTKAILDTQYDAEDTAIIQFSYENSFYGSIILSRYYPPKTEKIIFLGAYGKIELDKRSIKRFSNQGQIVEEYLLDFSATTIAGQQIDAFCDMIKRGESKLFSFEKQLEPVAFAESCYLSNEQNMPINPISHLMDSVCLN